MGDDGLFNCSELTFNSILVLLFLFMNGLLFFSFAQEAERGRFIADGKHNGEAVHDWRQWRCIGGEQKKGN